MLPEKRMPIMSPDVPTWRTASRQRRTTSSLLQPTITDDMPANTFEEADSPQTYAFLPAYRAPAEVERLDNLHKGITEYFGQCLSLAPLEDTDPGSILELGSGSGAWAIQAALHFPRAEVLAVDLYPLPDRPLPHNLRFQKVDLTQPLPFAKESFDIVHARLVMMHLPRGADILRSVIEVVKPGGWLIVEDPDDDHMQDGGGLPGPATSMFVKSWLNILRSRGAEPSIGGHLEQILKSSGYFEEVNVRKVAIPISEQSPDPMENHLGSVWRVNMKRNICDLPERFADRGITKEIAEQMLRELEDCERSLTTDMYFTWSRRRVD